MVRGIFVKVFALLDIQKFQEIHCVTKTDISVLSFVLWIQILAYSYSDKLPTDWLREFLDIFYNKIFYQSSKLHNTLLNHLYDNLRFCNLAATTYITEQF